MDPDFVQRLLGLEKLKHSGHGVNRETGDLGLGYLYYGLARVARPQVAVVVGSWRGFVPIVIARAFQDNGPGGRVLIIDPGLVDDFWHDARRVDEHWDTFGVGATVEHWRWTTQEITMAEGTSIGLLFIDGKHTWEQAEYDHEKFEPYLAPDAITLFHDSRSRDLSTLYPEPYRHSVWQHIEDLREGGQHDVIDLDVGQGLAMVRRRP